MQPRDPLLLLWTAAVFAAFAVFIGLAQIASRRPAGGLWGAFAAQVLTTAWMLGSAWVGGGWFVVAIAATSAAASREMARTVRRLGSRPWTEGVVAASVGYCVAAVFSEAWILRVFLAFALLLLFQPVLRGSLEGAFARGAASVMASVYPGLFFAFAVRLPSLGNALGDFAYLYAVLEINDACASLVGRFAGRRPYASVLSPRKTREGALGGLAGAAGAGALLSFLLPGVSPTIGGLLGLLLGTWGQAADLAASAIKRQAGVKDFADTVPTQGGALDVYDALIFSFPPWYVVLQLLR